MILVGYAIFNFVKVSTVGKKITAGIDVIDVMVSKDDKASAIISFENKSIFLAQYLMVEFGVKPVGYKDYIYEKATVTVKGKSKTRLKIPVDTSHVGVCEIIIKKAYFYDDIYMFKKKIIKNPIVGKKYILPNYYMNNGITIEAKLDVDYFGDKTDNHYGGDEAEIVDIREYIPGDRINRIHWKVSSKYGKLYVKELSSPIESDIILKLDNLKCSIEMRDIMFEALYSLMLELIRNSISFNMVFLDKGVLSKVEIFDERQIEEIMPVLVSLESHDGNALNKALALAELDMESENVIAVTMLLSNDDSDKNFPIIVLGSSKEYIDVRKWLIREA